MPVQTLTKAFTKVFGSRNERLIKGYHRRVENINAIEPDFRGLSDGELRAKTAEFQKRLAGGERIGTLMPQVLAAAREAMDRAVGIRNIFNPEFAEKFPVDKLSDSLRRTYDQLKQRAAELEPITEPGCVEPVPGWMQIEIPAELYEAVREIYPRSRPPFRARPFDVQLIGGMVLSEGTIAEMKTGEGKTIVAPLACYVACIEGLQCHVVTVNDYLVQRDRDWVFPFYYWLGLTVGAIHPHHMQPPAKKAEAYGCNVLYGTNSEFGFDYLRDNMKLSTGEQVQKHRDFCIIDEVDSILVDEARTPLIISGPAHEDAPRYSVADNIARHLMQKQRDWDEADQRLQRAVVKAKGLEGDIRNARDKGKIASMREELKKLEDEEIPRLEAERDKHVQYYEVERERKAAHLTHDGVAEAQKMAGIGSFYSGNNMDMPHLLENALRAHAVYQRDRAYVVEGGEVIIVDEFTGRKMIGRQWSDGLHQAVEAKERVKIKEETQTLATVTIQNFFKLYKRLAGMTGTAATESTEFHEIYKLDVVSIPTNVPVVRRDYDDLVFLSQKDKWEAILDEIKRMHDVGRPVLVGTTSVETSESLSERLKRKHNIQHEVLNAKQHEREAHIVEHAGELGAVMIATNMAGRGTDIKLAPIARDALVHHWQQRNLLPKQAKAAMTDEELVTLAYGHLGMREFGWKQKDVEGMSDEEIRLKLLQHWLTTEMYYEPAKVGSWTIEQCQQALDKLPEFMLHRLRVYKHVEDLGGLAIVGTERHESRRIDNQLRGRSGRQGDKGSSRFFISLEDDLMKMFANKTVLKMLSRLGMKEGDAIEHSMVTKSVERAQRKVEERNYEIRKNLLEWDEVMDHQRSAFYGIRQEVLEGHGIDRIIFDYLEAAIADAVGIYLDSEYVPTQIAEWCRQTVDVSVDPAKLRGDTVYELEDVIRAEARAEAAQMIETSLGEYISDDTPVEEWDTRGLSHWAMSRFQLDLKQNQIRRMSIPEVREQIVAAAHEQIEKVDLSEVSKFLEPLYAQKQLALWVQNQFGIQIDPKELDVPADRADDLLLAKARDAYQRREIEYPVDFIMELAYANAQQGDDAARWAVNELTAWANSRFDAGWEPEQTLKKMSDPDALRGELIELSRKWHTTDVLERVVRDKMNQQRDAKALAQWAKQRFAEDVDEQELADADDERRFELLHDAGRKMLRNELEQLERFVLLQILDQAWKDHLYAMDQLKDAVGLRAYAEQDPRIAYKREGATQFRAMQKLVRDKVTGLIFRARLTPNVRMRSVYHEAETRHDEADSLTRRTPSAASQGTAEQRADLAAAQAAGSRDTQQFASRKQRRAAAKASGSTKSGSPKGGKRRRR